MKILEKNVTARWYNNKKTLKQKRPWNPKGKEDKFGMSLGHMCQGWGVQ